MNLAMLILIKNTFENLDYKYVSRKENLLFFFLNGVSFCNIPPRCILIWLQHNLTLEPVNQVVSFQVNLLIKHNKTIIKLKNDLQIQM